MMSQKSWFLVCLLLACAVMAYSNYDVPQMKGPFWFSVAIGLSIMFKLGFISVNGIRQSHSESQSTNGKSP